MSVWTGSIRTSGASCSHRRQYRKIARNVPISLLIVLCPVPVSWRAC